MLLSLQKRCTSDDRTISELFLLMVDELADITFSNAFQLIVDILLQSAKKFFDVQEAKLTEFVNLFCSRLPISCQKALHLPVA